MIFRASLVKVLRLRRGRSGSGMITKGAFAAAGLSVAEVGEAGEVRGTRAIFLSQVVPWEAKRMIKAEI